MYFWRIAHLCLQLRSSTASWCRASFVSQRSLCGNASDLSLSLFISSSSFCLWFHDTCHLMLFTQYSLLDQFYFCTSCLSIAYFEFTNKIHQLFIDYLFTTTILRAAWNTSVSLSGQPSSSFHLAVAVSRNNVVFCVANDYDRLVFQRYT